MTIVRAIRGSLSWLLVASVAACSGDDTVATDAGMARAESGVDAGAPTDAPGAAMCDAATGDFWTTLCSIASDCLWLESGHPELGGSETECLERLAGSPLVSTSLPYMAGFERCVFQAAACGSCTALRDCYFRPDIGVENCRDLFRCLDVDGGPTPCEAPVGGVDAGGADAGASATPKFDQACAVWCLETLPADAPCTDVETCFGACT